MISLRYFEGLTIREIACVLEVTESAVKNRVCRARAILRDFAQQLELEHSANVACGRYCGGGRNSLLKEVD
jgi:DNA-directed RNA polymerase specialized sigma24 family protein